MVEIFEGLNEQQLRRLLVEYLTRQKLGLYWESNAIERDAAINANAVLPQFVSELSYRPGEMPESALSHNLIIEGDNFDSLRLLRATHGGKIRVIYIDPPYNTGNKDWVYNDDYVGRNDRWRHSQWLEFLYRRLILARDLLTSDGVILVSINDENRARLEMLMDEVFPGRRLGSLVWRTKDTGNDLERRFSHVHEHVLIYANPGFTFNGRATNRSKFRNPDNDIRGDWAPRPLTKAHTYAERPNTYYPIQNPKTGYWYPCDPERVWSLASETKMVPGQRLRSASIESMIGNDLIYFPPCKPDDVMFFKSKKELLDAIRSGKGPMLPKKKTQLLREDLPDIEFWVGKRIAPGRPSFKDHWTSKPESERTAPLSSWIAGLNENIESIEDEENEIPVVLRSARVGVGTEEVKEIFGTKAFQFPKPLSLIQGLLSQSTRPDDIILDFFAGSGTTGEAVLSLNAEDGGHRRFILCSSTEATLKEPLKNICRDICAERVRKVIAGIGDKPGFSLEQGGEFAYLRLALIPSADIHFEAQADNAFWFISLKRVDGIRSMPPTELKQIGRVEDCDVLFCSDVTPQIVDKLANWPQVAGVTRMAIYAPRPTTVREQLIARGVQANCYGLVDTMLRGQLGAVGVEQ